MCLEERGVQGQGRVIRGKGGSKEELVEWMRGKEGHKRAERTKEHLSDLSALK